MGKKQKIPVTPGVRALRKHGVAFEPCLYDYRDKGGTTRSSEALGVSEHHVIKTLVVADETGRCSLVLMHGDREVSTGALARFAGVKSMHPASPAVAQKSTGYLFGGTSPFGTRRPMTVYVETTILALETIYINGGKRGFLVAVRPGEALEHLECVPVSVAT